MLSDTASVSVLFSEPKIPQSVTLGDKLADVIQRFSALQRAENSSIAVQRAASAGRDEFQCSSASRKFLNATAVGTDRASHWFQCSSASRKFLNGVRASASADFRGFSALQRAENSSIDTATFTTVSVKRFSALQRAENSSMPAHPNDANRVREFQCSSASRKFLNCRHQTERS